ncbi:MAG: Arm DNA-binding domain-containing protein [Rhizobiaceae bacterium]|nr:Arm DNA-binding domain-containing protein [Rhizobiaceae bacterium]
MVLAGFRVRHGVQPSGDIRRICWYLCWYVVKYQRDWAEPIPTMPLSDRQISGLKLGAGPRKISDGGGLHLLVTPQGSKLWRMAYRFEAKQKLLSFGSYPAVTLSAARAKRDAAKALLASGVDPAAQAKVQKAAATVASASTFELVALEMLAKDEREGKPATTVNKKRWLLSLAASSLGNRPIGELTAAEILVPLRKVEAVGNGAFPMPPRKRART